MGRFAHVAAAHWPVFAVLAIVAAAVLLFSGLRPGAGPDESGETTTVSTVVGWSLVFVVPPLIYLLALAGDLSTQAAMFAALLTVTGLLWVFSLTEEFVGPLVVIVGALVVGLAPPEVALSGFASPNLLLLVGVVALSAVISSSGLSYRFIIGLLLRLPDRPFWHQTALLASGYVLSPLVPSCNMRLTLLRPPFVSMVEGLQLRRGGPGATALLASMFGGAVLMSPMFVTSKSANIAAVNFLPQQMQAEFNGIFWFVAAAAAALVVTAVHLIIVRRMFRTEAEAPMPRAELQQSLRALGPLGSTERVAVGALLFFVVGIATVGWHHVKPPYLAGCVLMILLLTGTLLRKDFRAALDWPMIFFLLGINSMVQVMNYLGLQKKLAAAFDGRFDFVQGNIAVFILVALAVTLVVRLALPVTAGGLTTSVILLPVATAQGINPWICIFCAAVFADIAFFRYQGTNGLLQVYSDGLVDAADEKGFLRYQMAMNAARVLAVYASIPWWGALGLA